MLYIYKEIFVYEVILNWKASNWIMKNTESSRTPTQQLSLQLTDRPHPRATKLSFGKRDAPSQMTYSSDGTYWRTKTGTRASVHYADGRLTTRSYEALKPRDLDLNFPIAPKFVVPSSAAEMLVIAYIYCGGCWNDLIQLQHPVQLATKPVQSHD